MFSNRSNSLITIKLSLGWLMMASLTVFAQPSVETTKVLTFTQAIKAAQKHDPWLQGSRYQQDAVESASIAADTLPDPKVSLGLANLPVNGFDINQEGMTQIKVTVAQLFPRGETLKFTSQQLQLEGEIYPLQRVDRTAKVAVTVGSIWLDAFRVQQSMVLIEKNRALFEQLSEVANASYSSALEKTRQQDLISAQLELSRLEERLNQLVQEKNHYDGMLSQWIVSLAIEKNYPAETDFSWHNITVSQQLPTIELLSSELVQASTWLKPQALLTYFNTHPAVMAIDKKVNATKTGIKLAEQKYKPEWGVNASYGYRADDLVGESRADLFSVGVTFDLPIFTEHRQDNEVRSAIAKTEAVKTEKLLLLRQLLGAYASAKGRLLRLKNRQNLYQSKLLPQTHAQAEALLAAYTNDEGDFSEVVRARIALLNAEIEHLTLNVEEQKIHLELNYLFIGGINSTMTNNGPNANNRSQYATMPGENE